MNVKPGDFAKVIPPHFRAGTFVSVLEAATPDDYAVLCAGDPSWARVKLVWACRLLMGTPGIDLEGRKSYFLPGDEAWFADEYLRRIDPKTDDTADEAAGCLPAPREAVPA